MKKILSLLVVFAIGNSFAQEKTCDPSKEKNYKSLTKQNKAGGYGEIVKPEGAVTLSSVETKMKQSNQTELGPILVSGKVEEVCQMKGCWMTIDNGEGQKIRVRFKDYAFFVPMNISGWTAYVQGSAHFDTTSVAMLKHYAEDGKKPQAEIDAITEPKVELNFTATGVLFEKQQ